MRQISKYMAAIGIAALSVGFVSLAAQPKASFAMSDFLLAQSNDTRGKSDNNMGRPGNPGTQVPPAATQTPSSTQPNSPQTGVPARCAAVANATERQKCMETPKGQ